MEIKGNPLGMALLMAGILVFLVADWWSGRKALHRNGRPHRRRPAH